MSYRIMTRNLLIGENATHQNNKRRSWQSGAIGWDTGFTRRSGEYHLGGVGFP
jgi:hypothetical protein